MVTRRLTRTRLRASAREPLERLTDTIAGSSCGVMPIAMARLKSRASISGRSRATLIAKIPTVRTPATLTSRAEKPRSPSWKAVSVGRSPSPTAIFPKAVAMPVATTTPSPEPWWTMVPMKAHDGRSTAESEGGSGAVDFGAGSDSPVSTASSHSSPLASRSRRSAGTTSPTRSAMTSPGTRVVTSTLSSVPSRRTRAS